VLKKALGWLAAIIAGFLVIRAVAANPAGAAHTVSHIWDSFWTFLVNL